MPPSSAHKPEVPLEEECFAPVSRWTNSAAKRIFDIAVIFLFGPVILVLSVIIVCALRFMSSEPALYRQMRIGRLGSRFEILKFRTMRNHPKLEPHPIAACSNDRITPFGRFLRQSKLDELPQVVNILRGDMSLVGPRPKVPDQSTGLFACRPGLTGAATLVFADEMRLTAAVPRQELPAFYQHALLPAKRKLDIEYMKRATLLSDVQILLQSVARVWAPRRNPAVALHAHPPGNPIFLRPASAPSSTTEQNS